MSRSIFKNFSDHAAPGTGAINAISGSLKIKHATREYQVTVDAHGVSAVTLDGFGASDYVVFVMTKNSYPFIPVQSNNGNWNAYSNFYQYSGMYTFDVFYFNYS
ncbi:MAG: hypothetical protein J6Z27_04555 [Bacteroidales bacterium]|nr:hypothetical protein [Bacteroidales bacterium]